MLYIAIVPKFVIKNVNHFFLETCFAYTFRARIRTIRGKMKFLSLLRKPSLVILDDRLKSQYQDNARSVFTSYGMEWIGLVFVSIELVLLSRPPVRAGGLPPVNFEKRVDFTGKCTNKPL